MSQSDDEMLFTPLSRPDSPRNLESLYKSNQAIKDQILRDLLGPLSDAALVAFRNEDQNTLNKLLANSEDVNAVRRALSYLNKS